MWQPGTFWSLKTSYARLGLGFGLHGEGELTVDIIDGSMTPRDTWPPGVPRDGKINSLSSGLLIVTLTYTFNRAGSRGGVEEVATPFLFPSYYKMKMQFLLSHVYFSLTICVSPLK